MSSKVLTAVPVEGVGLKGLCWLRSTSGDVEVGGGVRKGVVWGDDLDTHSGDEWGTHRGEEWGKVVRGVLMTLIGVFREVKLLVLLLGSNLRWTFSGIGFRMFVEIVGISISE